MQANNRDKDFQDHGWKEMEKLLNQEMPVRVLPWWRRLGILIPFLLFTGVLLGGSLWWFNVGETNNPTPSEKMEAPLPVAPIADAAVEPSADNETAPLSNPETNPLNPVDHSAKANPKSAIANQPALQTESAELNVVNAVNPTVQASQAAEQNNGTDEVEISIPEQQETILAENRTATLTESLVQELTPLLDASPEFKDPGYAFPDPMKSRMQFGLTAASNFGNLPGLSAGFAVQKQIGKSRFSWQTGLEIGVQVRNFNGNDTPLFSPLEDLFQDQDTTAGEIASNAATPDHIFYMSLELPVLFRYRIAPRWSVNLGGKVGYHVLGNPNINGLASSNYERVDLLSTSTYFYNSASENLGIGSGAMDPNQYTENIQRNRFSWALSAGIDWHLTNRFTLTSMFQYGVRDEYPLRDDFANRLGAEFRMTYFFNRPTR